MKNIPQIIYLQTGEVIEDGVRDFKELTSDELLTVTWAQDKIHYGDTGYVRLPEPDFDKYLGETRDSFVLFIKSLSLQPSKRVTAENLLIAFDQMRDKLTITPSK